MAHTSKLTRDKASHTIFRWCKNLFLAVWDSLGPGHLRYILALAVLVSHLSRLRIGLIAVFVFFLLSGYWIARMYCEKYSKYENNYKIFITSRILRIYPLYIACCLIATLLYISFSANEEIDFIYTHIISTLRNILLFTVSSSDHIILGVSWSLDIELQFYIIAPLLATVIVTMPFYKSSIVLLVLTSFSLFSMLNGFYMEYFPNVISYLSMFWIGMMIYRYKYNPSRTVAIISATAFIITLILFSLMPTTYNLVISDNSAIGRAGEQLAFSFMTVLLLIPFVANNVQKPSSSYDKKLGDMSYPLYLIHFPIVFLITHHIQANTRTDELILKLGAIIISILATYMLHIWIDQPLEKLRSKLVRSMLTGRKPQN